MINRCMPEFLDDLEEEQKGAIEENTFLDFFEPEILEDSIYRQLEFKKYGYAVVNSESE